MLPEKVVLAYDFSDAMEGLLDRLNNLKKLGIKEVYILHVSDITKSGAHGQITRDNRSDKLSSVKARVEEMGFDKVNKDVLLGFPSEEISKYGKRKDAMILIGSHGRGVIKNVFLGGTAYEIIRKAKTPVLVEKVRDENPPKDITKKLLLPTDFSEESQELLDLFQNSDVNFNETFFLSVIERGETKRELEERRKELDEKLKELKDELDGTKRFGKVDYGIEEGAASRMISSKSRSEEVSMISMVSRKRSGIKEMLIGTTAKEVTRLSSVPILLVPGETL